MERVKIGDQLAGEVIGGSIIFTTDHKTCGLNCNNQFKVNDYGAIISYIAANYKTMKEIDMLRNLLAQGLITKL